MIKRLFDICFACLGLLFLSPILVLIAIIIKLESKGSVFYKQVRVGKNNKDFKIFKFRTMFVGSDKKGLLTVGDRDPRITRVGFFLRKYKLDELPQLINVFIGNMSFVGPRPEVRKYVDLYTKEQQKVLTVTPGITDYASIMYRDEAELLKQAEDSENMYIKKIMPKKLSLNLQYISDSNLLTDVKIIFKTFTAILK